MLLQDIVNRPAEKIIKNDLGKLFADWHNCIQQNHCSKTTRATFHSVLHLLIQSMAWKAAQVQRTGINVTDFCHNEVKNSTKIDK